MAKLKKIKKPSFPRVIGYIRCSTEEQANEGLSLRGTDVYTKKYEEANVREVFKVK